MERKIIKFITLFMLVGILCCTNISAVWASDTSDITEATDLETDLDSSEDTVYSVLRGTNLNYGTTKVSKLASNKVGVSGITQCHHACDTVYLELYLQSTWLSRCKRRKQGICNHSNKRCADQIIKNNFIA